MKKIFKIYKCIFAIISPWKRAGPSFYKLASPSSEDTRTKFGCNWPSGSREDENVKSLQIDRQTHGRRTTGDQKSSLRVSAKLS